MHAARWGTAVARALVAAVLVVAACSGGDDPPGRSSTSATAATATTASTATTRPADAEGTTQWRPATHYTPGRNWMNDPNGLVYHDGTWHLFYQHNPRGDGLGNMSWGHATSPDLVTWAEQPVAIEATDDELVFSGSIVVDHDNTSGLGTGGEPPLVAVYTSVYGDGSGFPANTQAQSLAYSTDGGTTWRRYEGNPVLRLGEPEARSFRDPKVFWYEPGGYWVMAAVVAEAKVVKLFRSDDLVTWDHLSDVAGVAEGGDDWEVPDLFPLALDGEGGDERWVLVVSLNGGNVAEGSGVQYVVGEFDGTTFRPGGDPAPVDHGADFYAAGTWNDAPDGDRIGIAWMANWAYAAEVPTAPWRGAMTAPRRLALRTVDDEPRLVAEPAVPDRRAGAAYEADAVTVDGDGDGDGDGTVDGGVEELPPAARGAVADVEVVLDPGTATTAGLAVRRSADGSEEVRIAYEPATRTLTVDRSRSGEVDFSPEFTPVHRAHVPASAVEDGLDLRILVDRSSVEVFAAGGAVTFSDVVLPAGDSDGIALFAAGGDATFRDLRVRHP